VAPVGLLGMVYAWREAGPRTLIAGTGMLALGLTPYLYCFVTAENLLSWPRPAGFGELIDIFTRRTYGGVVGFTGSNEASRASENLVALGASLARTWVWVLLPIGIATLALQIARPVDRGSRHRWIALGVAWLLAGPILALRFNVAVEGYGLYVVRRFHVLPSMLLVIPVAVGLDALWNRWLASLKLRVPKELTRSVISIGVFFGLAATALPHVTAVHSPAMEMGVLNMLRSLPPNAVVLGKGDDLHVGTRYMQLVRGMRPDVVYVHWSAMGTGWYRERMARLGLVIPPSTEPPSIALALHVLASERPLFVDPSMTEILRRFPSYPHGLHVRVLPLGAKPPSLDEVVAINKELYGRFELGYAPPERDDDFPAQMHYRYAKTWLLLARALGSAGKQAEAAWAMDVSEQLAPR